MSLSTAASGPFPSPSFRRQWNHRRQKSAFIRFEARKKRPRGVNSGGQDKILSLSGSQAALGNQIIYKVLPCSPKRSLDHNGVIKCSLGTRTRIEVMAKPWSAQKGHSARSEESRIFSDLRSFTPLRMTVKSGFALASRKRPAAAHCT